MKLYLASTHVQFPDELVSLVGKRTNDTVVTLIVNAFDNYPTDRREVHITNLTESIKQAGYEPVQLDLRNYIGKTDALVSQLNETDLLWVSGGNIFYLRYLLRECGLDNTLQSLINGGMVYGGDSAGAAVMGHDLHGLDLLDDIDEAPEAIYEGLNITPFIILPHWGNERYQAEIANSKRELEKYNSEIVTISDDQVCIVDGATKKILG
jgi:dipeptidase E